MLDFIISDPVNINKEKEDLRVAKTNKRLLDALFILLSKQNFKKISVNDICEEALISRGAFYTRFGCKHDLLQYWLTEIAWNVFACNKSDIILTINGSIFKHKIIIKNIVEDADETVVDLLYEFVISVLNRVFEHQPDDILLVFCAGGVLSLLSCYIKNGFPPDTDLLSLELYNALRHCMEQK